MSMTETDPYRPDPDELLSNMRLAVMARSEKIAEFWQALDHHLSAGGDMPADWDRWEQAKRSVLAGYEAVEIEPLGGPEPGVNGSHLPEDEEQPDES